MPKKFIYPEARRDDTVVDDYHGTEIADPYRWLEDSDSPETSEFIDAQNRLTRSYLETYPSRADYNNRLKHLANYPKYYSPEKIANRYVFRKNTGLQNQNDLYLQDKLDSEPRLFLDVNSLSEDGTMSLGNYSFSEDGSFIAYTLNESGSDWCTIHFKDVLTGAELEEVHTDVKSTCLSWSHDSNGIFYCRYLDMADATGTATVSDELQKLFYHNVDTTQEDDVKVVELKDYPKCTLVETQVSHCGNYLVVMVTVGNNLVYICDLTKGVSANMELKAIIKEADAEYKYITNIGPEFIFLTNKNAPNSRIVKISLNEPDEGKWTEILAENEHEVLEQAILVNVDKLLVTYIQDVKHVLQLRCLATGDLLNILPLRFGQVESATGHRNHAEVFIKLVSFLIPCKIYHFCLDTMTETIFHETKFKCFDVDKYETKQIFYNARDETSIPMYIISERNMVRDGTKPTLMYGYGGCKIKGMPSFSTYFLVFMEQLKGSVAVVNIRGGGEYGQTWYEAGKLLNKQNCFDDFQAAGEYLISNEYTNKNKLVIQGGPSCGLLVGACINQRPDLFGAAITDVGVMDMLRFHKFTNCPYLLSDFGSSDDEEQFQYLLNYSPLHNIAVPEDTKTQYPSTLLLTSDHDERVVPMHSLKFIATLQNTLRDSPNQTNPLMIRIDTKSVQGESKSIKKSIEEQTDILCFIARSIKGLYCHCPEKPKTRPEKCDEKPHECC